MKSPSNPNTSNKYIFILNKILLGFIQNIIDNRFTQKASHSFVAVVSGWRQPANSPAKRGRAGDPELARETVPQLTIAANVVFNLLFSPSFTSHYIFIKTYVSSILYIWFSIDVHILQVGNLILY